MKKYYPTYWSGLNPIHEVQSWSKVRALIRAARKGDEIPPILVDGTLHNGNLLTGTHRAAANDLMVMLAEKKGETPKNLIGWTQYDPKTASKELWNAINNSDYELIDDLLDK